MANRLQQYQNARIQDISNKLSDEQRIYQGLQYEASSVSEEMTRIKDLLLNDSEATCDSLNMAGVLYQAIQTSIRFSQYRRAVWYIGIFDKFCKCNFGPAKCQQARKKTGQLAYIIFGTYCSCSASPKDGVYGFFLPLVSFSCTK